MPARSASTLRWRSRWRRSFGGAGVAIATAAAILVESGLLFLIAKRRLGLHLFIWQPRAG